MGGRANIKRCPLFQLLKSLYPDQKEKELYSKILCGEVQIDGGVIKDPKLLVRIDSEIVLKESPFVSRGGEKLDHALNLFDINTRDRIFLDAGASTGGFTHCLLTRGAQRVYSVDVGYNQLDYSLRMDSRIVVYERTNIMDVDYLDPAPNAAVADLSFRSIKGAASHILSLTIEKWMIALIKPQFEWKNPPDYFNGVVSGREDQITIIRDVVSGLNEEGVCVQKVTSSPIPGRKGNREFLFLLGLDLGLSSEDVTKILFFD